MLTDPIAMAIGCLAVFFAAVSKSGLGGGASFVAAPLMTMVVDPAVALAVLLPVLIVIDFATLKPYWRRWNGRETRLLLIGALPGIVLGTLIYHASDPNAIRLLIGVIALAFLGFQIARQTGWITPGGWQAPPWLGIVAGSVGGFTSFVSHAGGPPVTMYLLHKSLSKTAYQSTTVVVFWAINLAKAGPYAALGLFDTARLTVAAALVPAALLGVWVGVRAHRVVPERLFFGVTYLLLGITGSKLIYDALT